MMSAGMRLQRLVRNFCDLLGCSTGRLYLRCSEPSLRHPLLSQVVLNHERFHGANVLFPPLFFDRRVEALCDIATQTGRVYYIESSKQESSEQESSEQQEAMEHIGSLAIVPLECPAGVLGLCLCMDRQPYAFGQGERRLIEQYRGTLASTIEIVLTNLVATARTTATTQEILREQSEFVSMVSHELRVPLTAIKGYAALLQTYGLSLQRESRLMVEMTQAHQQQYLDSILEQTSHLEVLIKDLLDISRVQAGRLVLRSREIDLARLCQRVVQLVQRHSDERQPGRHAIHCSLDPRLPFVWADPDRVQQIITNLLENAVKYSPNGGTIEVVVSLRHDVYTPHLLSSQAEGDRSPRATRQEALWIQEGPEVYVTIRDQGIGIPYQHQSSLFRPFTRLEHPTTSHVEGMGLGLYISRKLVEAMHGRVMLHSREGVGTSITFTLPIVCSDEKRFSAEVKESVCVAHQGSS